MNFHNISEGTIEYIEHNLCDSLNLDTIANNMNYSKYHFHRLFLSEMGVSVAEYVRRRRIIRSAANLVLSDINISTIAYDFGFNNIDTYIRCFKRYYGITPSEYRKLKAKLMKISQEECTTMKNLEYDLRQCSMEDKQKAIISLEKIIELSRVAHKKGLLTLENIIKKNESSYLFKAIELLLDGTEPKKLREILSNYIMTSNLTPPELLERKIYLEGVLLIQQGEYPWDIRKELSAYFGEDFIDVLNDHFQTKEDLMDKLQDYECKEVIYSETKLLDNELRNIDKRSMQRPAHTYFLIQEDKRIIGAINIRHDLNEYLFNFGGHIGYGIRPSERKKGYASLMLSMALPIAKELGINEVLITCDKNNIGSAKTIINNGGVLENEVSGDGEITQRYWLAEES